MHDETYYGSNCFNYIPEKRLAIPRFLIPSQRNSIAYSMMHCGPKGFDSMLEKKNSLHDQIFAVAPKVLIQFPRAGTAMS